MDLVLQLQIIVGHLTTAAHLVRPDCLQVSFTFILFLHPSSDRSWHWLMALHKISSVPTPPQPAVMVSAYFGHNYDRGWWLDIIGYVVVMVVMVPHPNHVCYDGPVLQSWLPSFNNGLPTSTSMEITQVFWFKIKTQHNNPPPRRIFLVWKQRNHNQWRQSFTQQS